MSDAIIGDADGWTEIENEQVEQTGFILIPKGAAGYVSPSPTALFPTVDAANDAKAQLLKQGMPLDYLHVTEATLSHKRILKIKKAEPAAPSLIIKP